MLLDVHDQVAAELLTLPDVGQVRTAFMEYTEPSIATQLRAFEEDGITSAIVVPLLLTISDHSFDDIPTICGLADDPERLAQLRRDRIEVHRTSVRLEFAPLLDFSGLVRANLARRVRAVLGRAVTGTPGSDAARTGLVLVGYGSAEFDDEWNRFFRQTRLMAESDLGFAASSHAWCGHIVGYRRQPVIDAVDDLLARTDRVLVVPLLVAYDPMFHERIIGRAVARCSEPSRVLYSADAILPEPAVGRWVAQIAGRMLASADSSG
jgi:sirohydrochlorin ferrochelatase